MVNAVFSRRLRRSSRPRYSASCQIGTIGSPVSWIVTRGRPKALGVDVPGSAGPKPLPPPGPPGDPPGKEVMEARAKAGDVGDLPWVVPERPPPPQTAAEDVGMLLHRHHRAQSAL